jgi:hypothetical protein
MSTTINARASRRMVSMVLAFVLAALLSGALAQHDAMQQAGVKKWQAGSTPQRCCLMAHAVTGINLMS